MPRRPSADDVGAAFAELVAVMDRLRSPGGCPWDAEQTHASLAPYAIEEAYEVADAAERGDTAHLQEELGDLLLQVVFHARVAAEDAEHPFDVLTVVRGLTRKLERRHPHVFGDVVVAGPDDVNANWERIKEAERGGAHGEVPLAMPALVRAQKLVRRARRAGSTVRVPAAADDAAAAVGTRLLAAVVAAEECGVDAEAALRTALRAHEDDLAGDAYDVRRPRPPGEAPP